VVSTKLRQPKQIPGSGSYFLIAFFLKCLYADLLTSVTFTTIGSGRRAGTGGPGGDRRVGGGDV
jgi:hypothetical protein